MKTFKTSNGDGRYTSEIQVSGAKVVVTGSAPLSRHDEEALGEIVQAAFERMSRRSQSPEPAPKLIMDANGHYWRVYPEGMSMVPTTTDNEPVPRPWVEYLPADAARVEQAALRVIGEAPVLLSGKTAQRIALEALGVPCKACGEPVTTEHEHVEVWQCGDLNGRYHRLCKPTLEQYRAARVSADIAAAVARPGGPDSKHADAQALCDCTVWMQEGEGIHSPLCSSVTGNG